MTTLAVLNPGGNDREQAFPDGAGAPAAATPHPPVNYHAYAACTHGTFYRDADRIPPAQREVLLVLRRDLGHCLKALRTLKEEGKRVAVSLKESGLHQVAQLLGEPGNMALFREICGLADGCVASTPEMPGVYRAAGGRNVRFIPTPYPVDDGRWDFSAPERNGIFIGTREWDVPSRNHAAALLAAASLNVPVTVVNGEGRAGRKRIEAAGIAVVDIIEGRKPYPEYLRLIARHRMVFQLDRSAVPGQVAGDALLCGIPCVGGDGAIERIAFPDSCGHGRTPEQLREIAAALLRDDGAAAVSKSREIAMGTLSFAAIATQLRDYFAAL
ncbi:MAG TPA: hypothetical protein VHY22_02920 [Chthoniobacteraceae bacterium]|jgi:hypothetical protein|nr:hypothetical protein [Chthoniobacteraceae bacterium]